MNRSPKEIALELLEQTTAGDSELPSDDELALLARAYLELDRRVMSRAPDRPASQLVASRPAPVAPERPAAPPIEVSFEALENYIERTGGDLETDRKTAQLELSRLLTRAVPVPSDPTLWRVRPDAGSPLDLSIRVKEYSDRRIATHIGVRGWTDTDKGPTARKRRRGRRRGTATSPPTPSPPTPITRPTRTRSVTW